MDWIEAMNAAVEHLEEHLTEEIDIEEVAKVAHCSAFHFQRIFACMASVSVFEYVRRRRMTLAAAELRDPQVRVIDVATRYGYSSPTAFTRAFQSVHGVAPSLVKHDGVQVRSYPPLAFTVQVRGREALDYRIEAGGQFRIVGLSIPMDPQLDANGAAIDSLWEVAGRAPIKDQLQAAADGEPAGLLGVVVPDQNADQWRYYAAVTSTAPVSGDLEELEIPAYTWAIFRGSGQSADDISALWERVLTEWLPTSGYEYADGPDVEVYQDETPGAARFEVRIPVRRP